VEIDEPEPHCDDLTFAEYEQGALEALRQGYQQALIYFINFCFQQGRGVPSWAQEMFSAAVVKALEFEIKSWDEAFGRPLEKGKQLDKERRKHRALSEVWRLVNERRLAGKPLDKALYEAVGKELGIGGATVVEEMYGKVARRFRDMPDGLAFISSLSPGFPSKSLGKGGETRTIRVKVDAKFAPPPKPRRPRKD
jgi:hypothetical protein